MKKLKSSIDALHRTAQHSTAPHGTARHGTARHRWDAIYSAKQLRENCRKKKFPLKLEDTTDTTFTHIYHCMFSGQSLIIFAAILSRPHITRPTQQHGFARKVETNAAP